MKALFYIILSISGIFLNAQEICDNAIDDDNDGLIDFNDEIDCVCEDNLVFTPTSLIPNSSFELTSCIPSDLGEMNCAEGWIQASQAGTSDFYHLDGFMGNGAEPASPPLPVADGKGFVAFGDLGENDLGSVFKEYVGSCLNSPILLDSIYNFEFYVGFGIQNSDYDFTVVSNDLDLTFFGNPNCNSLPFGDAGYLDCPLGLLGWEELGTINVTGSKEWKKANFTFTATQNYAALVIGPKCESSYATDDTAGYFFLDAFTVNTVTAFDKIGIIYQDLQCNNHKLSLDIVNNNFEIQWYYNNVAILNRNDIVLDLINAESGVYYATVNDGQNCEISTEIIVEETILPTFQIMEGNQTTVDYNISQELNISTNSLDYSLSWTPNIGLDCLNCLQNSFIAECDITYKATLMDNASGCTFTDTIQVKLEYPQLENCNIYFPNVFTPNNDGNNDKFKMYNSDCVKSINYINIFNRFGEKVFSKSSNNKAYQIDWNGNYKNKALNTGVFIYTAEIELVNKEKRFFKGNVTLLR